MHSRRSHPSLDGRICIFPGADDQLVHKVFCHCDGGYRNLQSAGARVAIKQREEPMSTTAPRLGQTEDPSQPQSTTQMVAEQAQEKALEMRQKAGTGLRSQIDQRSSEAGDSATAIARAVHSSAEELRSQGKDGPAKMVDQLGQKLDQLGTYLSSSDSDRLLRDVEDFARRQPAVVASAAVAVGFVAARFVGSSSRRRYGNRTTSTPTSGPRPPPASARAAALPPTVGGELDGPSS
jgi:hypothetical protein